MGYIVTVGGSSLDYYYEAESWPECGDKAMVKFLGVKVGGLISNAACVMARYGLHVHMIDLVSTEAAPLIFGELEMYGVDISQMIMDEKYVQSMTHIYLHRGEKTILICKQKPVVRLNDPQRKILTQADVLYTILPELRNLEGYAELVRLLKKNKGKLVFDMETAVFSNSEEDLVLMREADILFFNEMAIQKFCGPRKEEEGVRDLVEHGVSVVVVTKGDKGCTVYQGSHRVDVPGFHVDPVDTTGAGDAFNSVFLAEYLSGRPVDACAEIANAAGARAVTIRGPKSGAAAPEEIAAFMRRRRAGTTEQDTM